MKIENTGSTPVNPQRTENVQPANKKPASQEVRPVASGKDRAEVTESARLLAKARAALENSGDVENERVAMLKKQVESGNYEIPVDELAKRLATRMKTG
jgi:flagellar biosynthesis anti-sigma factor FlgM